MEEELNEDRDQINAEIKCEEWFNHNPNGCDLIQMALWDIIAEECKEWQDNNDDLPF